MKKELLIILPEGKIHKINVGSFSKSFREAPLTATVLAALVPEELNFNITIVDESIQNIPLNKSFDLVAISILTGTAHRGYVLAGIFKQKGAIVVLGGVHVSLCPGEAAEHAVSIVIGFAERSWPQLLKDFNNGNLKKKYKESNAYFDELPIARRDLQKSLAYMIPNTINATRGCLGNCDFCAVPAAGFGWHTRPISNVIDEIKALNAKRFVFNDVSMGEDMEYLKILLHEMKGLNKKWGGLVSTKVFRDPEILDLLKSSGCVYLLIGFESINNNALKNINKGFNKVKEYKKIIAQLRSIDVILMACFIFGLDDDHVDIFENTVDFVQEHKINIPRYAIYTPYPGTESFKRLLEENRILHTDWSYYDTQHVVFRPKNMTPEQLENGFKKAFYDTYSIKNSFKRTLASGKNFPITFGGNLAYRLYLKRLFPEFRKTFS